MSLKRFYFDRNIEICATCMFIDEYALNVHDDGEVIERDYNAALNILDEGLRIMEATINKNVGCCTSEFTLADCPPMDGTLSDEVLKSSGRMKQEVNNE